MTGNYLDVFRSLLDQIFHEDDLLVARTLWLVVSQFLLLIAYSIGDSGQLPKNLRISKSQFIGVVGMLTTAFIYAAVLAAEFDFVVLRTMLKKVVAEHPDLPLRPLPSAGLGSGLLAPILLSIVVLSMWVLLITGSRTTSTLCLGASALVALVVIGEAHDLAPGGPAALLIGASGLAAVATLGLALFFGVRSARALASSSRA